MTTTADDRHEAGEQTLRDVLEPLQVAIFETLDRFALPADGPTAAVDWLKIYGNGEVFGTQMRRVIEADDHPDAARTRCLGLLQTICLYVATCGPQPIN